MTGGIDAVWSGVYLVVAVALVVVIWRYSRNLGMAPAERAIGALYLGLAWPVYLFAGIGLLLLVSLVERRDASPRPTRTHTSEIPTLASLEPGDPRS